MLVVKPDAIAALAQTTHVVFGETGTLTMPRLTDVETFNDVSPEGALRTGRDPSSVEAQARQPQHAEAGGA